MSRGTLTRVTTDPALDTAPVWTADGHRLTFASTRGNRSTSNLYWQRADGGGKPDRLTESAHQQIPVSWHPSGEFLAFEEITPKTSVDIMILPVTGDEVSGWKPKTAYPLANTPAIEAGPEFSPDGRWLAYVSNESGRGEIYVQPFPGPGARTQVSSGGGSSPTWSRTRNEIFYGVTGQIMSARFSVAGDGFRPDKPSLWSTARYRTRGTRRMFDLHPDGQRFALAPADESEHGRQDKVILVLNFLDELRRLAPTTR
jgi:Tol biopolymer transport system component